MVLCLSVGSVNVVIIVIGGISSRKLLLFGWGCMSSSINCGSRMVKGNVICGVVCMLF